MDAEQFAVGLIFKDIILRCSKRDLHLILRKAYYFSRKDIGLDQWKVAIITFSSAPEKKIQFYNTGFAMIAF